MFNKQLSVFVENKKGRLAQIMQLIKENGINLRALSLADTTDFGILRFIATEPEKAQKALKDSGLTVNCHNVITVQLKDEPGSLAEVFSLMSENDIEIEYTYAFLSDKANSACVVLRTSDDEKAEKVLSNM